MSTTEPHTITQDGRYRRILLFFASIILHIIWWDILGTRLPLLADRIRQSRPNRLRRWARRFRALAASMGGVMIKLGQFLSARVDVLPPEITEELQGLQDEVPSEDPHHMMAVLSAELGAWRERFSCFEEQPLAAASLGQAHRAKLRTEEGIETAVVVKIQRPHIETIVQTDLAALHVVARWIMRYGPIRRRADVPALMDEFARTLWEELDYIAEADNAEHFAQIYADTPYIHIPLIHRHHSTRRVIVLEDVSAIKIADVDSLIEAGIDPTEVADKLLESYFRQIFQEGFFHADPHPGNLFVRPLGEADVENRPFAITFIDFGMVGRVPGLMGENLRKLLVSVTQRDARKLTEAYQDLGFFLPGADLERIVEAQDVLLNRLWGRNLLQLARPDPREVQELGRQFRDILFDFPFQIPQDFIYLGRAIGMVSGLVSLLDPQINPWYQIEKFGEQVIQSQEVRQWSWATVLDLVRPYLTTPAQVKRIIVAAENGRLRVQTQADRETLRRLEQLERRVGQLGWSVLGAAGLISTVLLYLGRKKQE